MGVDGMFRSTLKPVLHMHDTSRTREQDTHTHAQHCAPLTSDTHQTSLTIGLHSLTVLVSHLSSCTHMHTHARARARIHPPTKYTEYYRTSCFHVARRRVSPRRRSAVHLRRHALSCRGRYLAVRVRLGERKHTKTHAHTHTHTHYPHIATPSTAALTTLKSSSSSSSSTTTATATATATTTTTAPHQQR